jgi:hypothetical protein
MVWLIVLLIGWCSFVGFGWYIAIQKDRSPVEGILLGLLFGPLGCLVLALFPNGDPDQRSSRDEIRYESADVDDAPELPWLQEMVGNHPLRSKEEDWLRDLEERSRKTP